MKMFLYSSYYSPLSCDFIALLWTLELKQECESLRMKMCCVLKPCQKRRNERESQFRPFAYIEALNRKAEKSWAEPESIKILCCSINFISLNIYRSRYVCADSLRRSQRKTWQKMEGIFLPKLCDMGNSVLTDCKCDFNFFDCQP